MLTTNVWVVILGSYVILISFEWPDYIIPINHQTVKYKYKNKH